MNPLVVITGLAQGMGREVAKGLASQGYNVAGFDVDGKGLQSLQVELAAQGGQHLLEELDITDRPGMLAFRDRVLQTYGKVDTVLANVGIGFFGPFEEIDLEQGLRCLEINVIGTAAFLQAFLPSMRKARAGKIVCVSSLVGQVPFPFESMYSASKFAVEGLVQSLKIEVEPFGLKVAIIQPAQVSTTFAAKTHHLPPEGSPYRERVRRFIDRDHELIQHAPTPKQAAEKIIKVIKSDRPPRFSQLDRMSSVFLMLNRLLPHKLRDLILVNHMGIRQAAS